jgi:hypothetical protein
MPRPCAVEGCAFKYSPPAGGMIHRFPANLTLRKLWTTSVGRPDEEAQSFSNLGVCSNHFTAKQYKFQYVEGKKCQLLHYAVPSVNLPPLNANGIQMK